MQQDDYARDKNNRGMALETQSRAIGVEPVDGVDDDVLFYVLV